MKLALLALIVVLALGLVSVGGTFAVFSDSEFSQDNYFETGSLDLKVAKCDDNWGNCSDWSDDAPWGTRLFPKRIDDKVKIVPCFNIPDGYVCQQSYDCNLLLWNAGCIDSMAYIHVKIVEDEKELSKSIDMDIWYDDDGNGEIDNGETKEDRVVSDTIYNLSCKQTRLGDLLGDLPAEEARKLKIEIHAHGGLSGDSLTFNIQFELLGPYFIDTGESLNYLSDTEESLNNYFRLN